jgi:hypothetical protein
LGGHHVGLGAAGEPEIGNFHFPLVVLVFGDEDVEGFQVAVDDDWLHGVQELHPLRNF